jgi:GNAT superfamily N-acetyltransferase
MVETRRSVEVIKPPAACAAEQLDAFAELVRCGGQVRAVGLRRRVAAAHWLAFHYEGNEIVAVGALKRPTPDYRARVFEQAQSTLTDAAFDIELGWVFTRGEFRRQGIGARLVGGLLEKAGTANVFATSRSRNRTMQRLLAASGFERTGRPFPSTNGEHSIQLWLRLHT